MIKCDLLIDDCIDNVLNADYVSILLDYPWNSTAIFDEAEYDNIYRVFDWLQVEPMIEHIEKVNLKGANKYERNGLFKNEKR